MGEGAPRQIVCGAWNFGAGATVAVALPGARLPGAEAPLGEAKLRGEVSRGMILSERELELGADHAGIMVLAEDRAGDTARRRAAARRPDHGRRADGEPGRPAVRLRRRARGGGALRARARAASRYRSGAARDGEHRHPHRRPRRLSALRGAHLRRRPDRPLAALAPRAAHRRRDASDLERRRHHELRHARARQPAPRLRSHLARRRPDRRPPGGARREAPDARRRRPRARRAGSRDRGRRACDRARGDHGRRGDGGARVEHRDPARGGQLRAVRAAAELGAAQAAHGGLEPLGEGRRSVPRPAGGVVRHGAARRARRRPLARGDRCPRRAAASSRRPVPARACGRADRARDAPGRAARDPERLRLRGRRRLERDRPDVAEPRRDARGRSDRGDRTGPDGRRSRSRCPCGARCSAP